MSVALIHLVRRGDAIDAELKSHHGERSIKLTKQGEIVVLQDGDQYIYLTMAVLDEDTVIKMLVDHAPVSVRLESPGIIESVMIGTRPQGHHEA